MEKPRQWQCVVLGASRKQEDKAPHGFLTKIHLAFPQGEHNHCLFLCLALAMHYMGLKAESEKIAALAF